ncbi:hypothetical protein MKEN_00491500 [Mycena kentingensis (nom. inval.)]|nr:hypothetical protein MKEN_00491500 [Mycena kentingensis (nom. inval.)]
MQTTTPTAPAVLNPLTHGRLHCRVCIEVALDDPSVSPRHRLDGKLKWGTLRSTLRPMFSLGRRRELFASPPLLFASFVAVQTVHGVVQAGFKDEAHPSRRDPPFHLLAAIELAKFLVTTVLIQVDGSPRPVDLEALALHPPNGLPHSPMAIAFVEKPLSSSMKALYPIVFPISAFFFADHLLLGFRRAYAKQSALDAADALGILFVALYSHVLLARTTHLRQITSAFLQALYLCRHVAKLPSYNAATYSLVFLSVSIASTVPVVVSRLYRFLADTSVHKINLAIFSSCFVVYGAAAFIFPSNSPSPITFSAHPRDTIASIVVVCLRIVADLLRLAIIYYASPFTLSVLTLLATSLSNPLAHEAFRPPDHFNSFQWLSSLLAIYAAASYLLDGTTTAEGNSAAGSPKGKANYPRRSLTLLVPLLAPFLLVLAVSPLVPIPRPTASFRPEQPRLMPHQYAAEYPDRPVFNANASASCTRRPLPRSSEYFGTGGSRPDFHAFDDVLLVVFFSHARYDVNLDGYREVYSSYFPNILFIGPGTREDRGFLYSEDVVVDTYESEDDYNAGWLKMGGRMAHHMFYTAVKDHPCYAGYLWAPFDAFLNVPRLMQFPQDRIWYYTPFADIRRYIPNPATGDVALRPNPARVSELTPEEYTREMNAWGRRWDWWWGEKHVGLEICARALEKMPLRMQERLAEITGSGPLSLGLPHFVGGSADTMYIPASLRWDFLDVVGTWLQTECFLEIAIPTTPHLILPVGEDIIWLDHWWDYSPPMQTNTTFVRDRWAEGAEVDTFHSFHWGDTQAGGFFGPHETSVVELRSAMKDSFARQRIVPPSY